MKEEVPKIISQEKAKPKLEEVVEKILNLAPGVGGFSLQEFIKFPPDMQENIFTYLEEKKKEGMTQEELDEKAEELIMQSYHYSHVGIKQESRPVNSNEKLISRMKKKIERIRQDPKQNKNIH